jgi:hypothetical protein
VGKPLEKRLFEKKNEKDIMMFCKGKAILEGSRRLRLPHFKIIGT